MNKINFLIILINLLFITVLKCIVIINKSQDVLQIYINDDAINLKVSPTITLLPKQQFMQNGILQVRIMGKRACKGNFYNMLNDSSIIEFNFAQSVVKR